MGRPSHSRALGVWANGLLVGHWINPGRGPMEFRYDPTWAASEEGRPLSLSLPMNLDGLPIRGERVGHFFDNLLPDSDAIRQRIRTRFRTRSGDAFDLLAAVGRDCVGALQLLPDGALPKGIHEIDMTPLSESELEAALRATVSPALLRDEEEGHRISLAGAQEKTAFLWHEGHWCRPHGATPTTHIFKLPLGLVGGRQMDLTLSLENEWLCSRLLAGFGLPVATSELQHFGSTKALVVERFDRKLHSSGKYWLRLPQEDFCQALGLPSSQKYESEGGPGLLEIARVLQGSTARQQDLTTLLRASLLFWMLAAIDGHAKNFSLRLLPGGRYHLTPLYDVISAWPVTGSGQNQIHKTKLRLAMALRSTHKHYRMAEITRRHFDMTARLCGMAADLESIIVEVIERTPRVIEEVGRRLPEGFPGRVFEKVTAGFRGAVRGIER